MTPELKDALVSLDVVDLQSVFRRRACVMKSCPKFLVGHHIQSSNACCDDGSDELRCTRAWKLFFLLPKMLLHRPPLGGLLPKPQLLDRFSSFNRGQWINLLITSQDCLERASQAQRRRRPTQHQDNLERRAEWAEALVQIGELSAGRQALLLGTWQLACHL